MNRSNVDPDFYPSIKRLAAYGPRFQRVVRCHGGPAEVIAELRGMSAEEMYVVCLPSLPPPSFLITG
jgi:hypothetical protein